MRKNSLAAAAFGAIVLVFLIGAVRLVAMRFESGDIYPPYSSLRTDPLGTKAYFEALGALPGMSVERNFRPLEKLSGREASTAFFIGNPAAPYERTDEDTALALESFLRQGSRLVVLTFPERAGRFRPGASSRGEKEKAGEEKKEENTQGKTDSKDKEGKKEKDSKGGEHKTVYLEERWGFRMAFAETKQAEGETPAPKKNKKAERVSSDGALPTQISWHSDLVFKDLDASWQVLYAVAGDPVLIERRFGRGTIVLGTDSYLVSNEAVAKERHPAVFSLLAGTNQRMVFDEYLHGVREEPGVAALARRYRLAWALGAFLLVSGLFLWRNATSLVPRRDDGHDGTLFAVSPEGRDSLAGFTGLLRRNIPPSRIVRVSVDAWAKTMKYRRRDFRDEAQKVQRALSSAEQTGQGSPVALYRHISKILSERNNR